jgi:hypothetical protein
MQAYRTQHVEYTMWDVASLRGGGEEKEVAVRVVMEG